MKYTRKRKGQAIVLVTLALIAMCGLMGLAIDMGWAFFVEKSEQAAADAAAMAAVREALAIGGAIGPYSPGDTRTVTVNGSSYTVAIHQNELTAIPCPANTSLAPPATDNYQVACLHAEKNGYAIGAANADTGQNVMVAMGDTSLLNEIGVETEYWTVVNIAQRVPQLFSAVLGNTQGLVSSSATAAIVDSVVRGSLFLINREGDDLDIIGSSNPDPGRNLQMDGGPRLKIGGGILIASAANSGDSYTDNDYAASLGGTSSVVADWTEIRGAGAVQMGNNNTWITAPKSGGFDGPQYLDPLQGRGQPPLFPAGNIPDLEVIPVVGGALTPQSFPGGTDANGDPYGNIRPGIYFAATRDAQGNAVPTGARIDIQGNMRFTDINGGTNTGFDTKWIFIGGLGSQGGNASMELSAGQYVFAGAGRVGGKSDYVLDFSANPALDDKQTLGSMPSNYEGEMFILAGPNYPGINDLINHSTTPSNNKPGNLATIYNSLPYGKAAITAGNKDGPIVNLHGVNGEHVNFPDWLKGFESVVLWQDQDNSMVEYDSTGMVACNGGYAVTCPHDPPRDVKDSWQTELFLGAQQNFHIWGVAYQPRGSYTHIQAGGGNFGALQLVTGALRLQGNGDVDLGILDQPITIKVAALVR